MSFEILGALFFSKNLVSLSIYCKKMFPYHSHFFLISYDSLHIRTKDMTLLEYLSLTFTFNNYFWEKIEQGEISTIQYFFFFQLLGMKLKIESRRF